MKLGILAALACALMVSMLPPTASANPSQDQDRREPALGHPAERDRLTSDQYYDGFGLADQQVMVEVRVLVVTTDDRVFGIDLDSVVKRDPPKVRAFMQNLPLVGDLFGPAKPLTPPAQPPLGQAFLFDDLLVLDLRTADGPAGNVPVAADSKQGAIQTIEGWKLAIRPETGYPSIVLPELRLLGIDPPAVITGVEVRTPGVISTVAIPDARTLLIGGLASADVGDTSKVPFLGDIPLLGRLFRSTGEAHAEGRNLIVFVTPQIIQAEEE